MSFNFFVFQANIYVIVDDTFAASSEPHSFPDGESMLHVISLLLESMWFISYSLSSISNGQLS